MQKASIPRRGTKVDLGLFEKVIDCIPSTTLEQLHVLLRAYVLVSTFVCVCYHYRRAPNLLIQYICKSIYFGLVHCRLIAVCKEVAPVRCFSTLWESMSKARKWCDSASCFMHLWGLPAFSIYRGAMGSWHKLS